MGKAADFLSPADRAAHVPEPVYDAEPGFVADTDELVSRWYVRLPGGEIMFTEPMSGAEMKAKRFTMPK